MLPKWKLILTNWINCYINNTNKKELLVNFGALLDIISQLRENLNLDESKSSLLDAYTVQEFMVEKYPDFRFENGTVEPDNEEDVYVVASLLLFFVCVNSKNVDLKNAMCSKLSSADQEIIMKFSKHLLECPKITFTDVQVAITEACGQDIAAIEPTSLRVSVVETPPALRSFHSEVRRLQAALDAERFDRTYLQEELTRTNMKMEKLLKDKEQYKLEIVNLKSQISLCSSQDRESQGDSVECNNMSKLMGQLEQMEERLVSAQEQLENIQEERDTYKTKLNLLKSEHEKLMELSHQESSRATNLAEELEIERRNTQTLRELVAELRQHNHLNKIDSSVLESDDPDASMISLQQNLSACSELCADVIEVQLLEERAKTVGLKQQIQMLQDQLCEITRRTDEERTSLTEIISSKESTIMSLKHRVNEEIEENNTLKAIFDDEVAKLNNELNEQEQRLKGTQENSRHIIEKKMHEIQNLQEERMSLLQSLSDETSKLENIIKHLQDEIDSEKSSKSRLRDDYDNHIMKLNEKVLNRNNELVELQNKILEKGEIIETLQLELRREKEVREELSNRYNKEILHLNSVREQLEQDLQQKLDESKDLHKHLQEHIAFIDGMNKDNDNLKATILKLQADCEIVKDSKEKLLVEIKNRDVKAEQIYKETENLKNMLCEEKQKLQHNLNETGITVNSLQNEIQLKDHEVSKLKEDLQSQVEQNIKLCNKNQELNNLLIKYKNDILILEEKNNEWKIKKDLSEVEFGNEILKLRKELMDKSEDYNELESILQDNQASVKTLNDCIVNVNKQNANLEVENNELIIKVEEIETKLELIEQEKNENISKLKYDKQHLQDLLEAQKSEIIKLESLLMYEKQQNNLLQEDNNIEKLNLNNKCDLLQECQYKAEQELQSRQNEIDMLTVNVKELSKKFDQTLRDNEEVIAQLRHEKDTQASNFNKELTEVKEKWIKESESKSGVVNKLTNALEEVTRREAENIKQLIEEKEVLLNEKLNLTKECDLLQQYQVKAQQDLENRRKEIELLTIKIGELTDAFDEKLGDKDVLIDQLCQEKDALISKLREELIEERDMWVKESELKADAVSKLSKELEEVTRSKENAVKLLTEENHVLSNEKGNLTNECDILRQYQYEAQLELKSRQMEIDLLTFKVKELTEILHRSLRDKDEIIDQLRQEKETQISNLNKELNEVRGKWVKESESKADVVNKLKKKIEVMRREADSVKQLIKDKEVLLNEKLKLTNECDLLQKYQVKAQQDLENRRKEIELLTIKIGELTDAFDEKLGDKDVLIDQLCQEKDALISKLREELIEERDVRVKESELKADAVSKLSKELEEVTRSKENAVKLLTEENHVLSNEKGNLTNECDILRQYQHEAQLELKSRQMEIDLLTVKVKELTEILHRSLRDKDEIIDQLRQEKETQISNLNKELNEVRGKWVKESESKADVVNKLKKKLEVMRREADRVKQLIKDKEVLLNEKLKLTNECDLLQKYQVKAQQDLENRQKEIELLTIKIGELTDTFDEKLGDKDVLIDQLCQEKDALISKLREELNEEREKWLEESQSKAEAVNRLTKELEEVTRSKENALKLLSEENRVLSNGTVNLTYECDILRQYQYEAQQELESRRMKIDLLSEKVKELTEKLNMSLRDKDELTDQLRQDKDTLTSKFNQDLIEVREKWAKESESKADAVNKLTRKLEEITRNEADDVKQLSKEKQALLNEKLNLTRECNLLQQNKVKAQEDLEIRLKEIKLLTIKVEKLTETYEQKLRDKDELINQLRQEKDVLTSNLSEDLYKEREKWAKDSESKSDIINKLTKELEEITRSKSNALKVLSEENQVLSKDKVNLTNECDILKHQQCKLQQELDGRQMEIELLTVKVGELTEKLEENLRNTDQLHHEKDTLTNKLKKELIEEREKWVKESKSKDDTVNKLTKKVEEVTRREADAVKELIQEKEVLFNENRNLTKECGLLQQYQVKAQQELESKQKDIELLTIKVGGLTKELVEEREKRVKESEPKADTVSKVTKRFEEITSETDTVKLLRKENEILKKTRVPKESFAATSQERSTCTCSSQGVIVRDQHQQVDTTPTEHTQSSFESCKTISDLEKILQDRNRTVRSLQSDIIDLKSVIAESENKLLDVSNDLEVSKENCHQLSNQLKKIVHQKNEEIADLKKQLTKMSVTENRASQIIKVSAKYQAIILKRIAEIKSNTVLKELTNFGNTTNCENDLRRNLNAGTVTMEDLENFLDTTDRHLKRFSEKQLALQKERDRLVEVNKINESEIINMRKFLTELSVGIKTFSSVKEIYSQKLSRVVSLQRTVRREILDLEGRITDVTMCKLERGYAAVMQDLSECTMNLERWVERTIGRIISVEKLKQGFSSEMRPSVSTTTMQNASLEVQLEELEKSFCKLLEEIARAQKGEGAKDAQAVTVMEVRAEYEDKLNRMRAKMNQLYKEHIEIFKKKQREEIVLLEQELQKANEKLEESSQAYEEHIRSLTMELWNVGEKFLIKKDEAEWLRRKKHSGSLMSLQHVHSSGLARTQEEPSQPLDTHSLRSLPVTGNANTNNKNEGRALHMSDEEGEVFDNRFLRELSTTPARTARVAHPPAHRLSELQRRNSLCPPHLKSSYPAETQFVPAIQEEEIKCVGGPSMSLGGRAQRKEVGITAYKKPGPPTPSKQAGRLSATDSELRESLRVEAEPNGSRKTTTPSRIRALFRSAKGDNESTPRSRRLSNIFRKK